MSKNSELHEIKEIDEKVILVGVQLDDNSEKLEASLDELSELAKTAGAVTVGRVTQKRERINPATYLGKGKVEELGMAIKELGANGIICDDELTMVQMKNLSNALDVKIMDRTMLILDIFAAGAVSSEGKIQVELAQLKYRYSRLSGIGKSLSRLGGGIGTRGPGEKKLETDKRHINERISELKSNLKEIETHRDLLRKNRDRKNIPVVALVGYTNAGKSTILNRLTDAGVLAYDKLFATLDITTREVTLPMGSKIFLTDTVGFINKLPHHLVQAFRSTLEESKYADIILHIVDVSNKDRDLQMETVYKTLKSLGCEEKPVITVYNKIDKDVELPLPDDKTAFSEVSVSAKTGQGIDILLNSIETLLKSYKKKMKVLIPYSEGKMIDFIHGKCDIISEEHTEIGYVFELYSNEEISNRLNSYEITEV